ncbi:arginine deiminase family protein [Pyxidicoccus sp. 3LFB2]
MALEDQGLLNGLRVEEAEGLRSARRSLVESQSLALTEVECWTEWEQLDCIAVCRPAMLDVSSPMEASAVGFSAMVTCREMEGAFDRLHEAIARFGCKVFDLRDFLPESEHALSDTLVNRVFVRDVAAVMGHQLVMGTASFHVREAEFDSTHRALMSLVSGPARSSQQVLIQSAGMEFGDGFLLDSERLLVNVGLRSGARGLRGFLEVAWSAGFREVAVVRLPEQLGIIHLDLAFNVLGPRAVLARSFLRHIPLRVFRPGEAEQWEAFERYFTQRGQRVISFEPPRPDGFTSNYIYLGPQLILASQSAAPQLRPLAKEFGIEVESVDIEALERGNGSIRCLTMPLRRLRSS